MSPTVFQLKFYTLLKTKYQTILQLFETYCSLQEFFLLFSRQPKLVFVSNCRPISPLSNIDKIFEKLMHSRLIEFPEQKQIVYYRQFGLRKYLSTNHAILTFLKSVQKTLDDRQFACRIFTDHKKALDTVSHEILLEKLNHYDIR